MIDTHADDALWGCGNLAAGIAGTSGSDSVREISKGLWAPASAGVGSPSKWHRSMKCSCDAERSFSAEARHLVMKAWGVTASTLRPRP